MQLEYDKLRKDHLKHFEDQDQQHLFLLVNLFQLSLLSFYLLFLRQDYQLWFIWLGPVQVLLRLPLMDIINLIFILNSYLIFIIFMLKLFYYSQVLFPHYFVQFPLFLSEWVFLQKNFVVQKFHNIFFQMITQSKLEDYEQLDIMGGLLPVSQKSKNRLYLCWRNQKQIECKMIGPETKCYCNHRFKQHEYLNPQGKKAPCKAPKCKCKCFDYIPAHGANDFKCLCKHSYKEHDITTRKCTREKCVNCNGFASAWTCSCGSKFADHVTILETYQQRKAKGKSVNDMVRLNNQLNHVTEEGSLYKPVNSVKQDPQARVKMKRQSMELNMGYVQKKTIRHEEPQEIQEYSLGPRSKPMNSGKR